MIDLKLLQKDFDSLSAKLIRKGVDAASLENLKTKNEELKVLLTGEIPEDAPFEEIPALVYAQHWAESDAQPDDATVQRLIDEYGQEKADAIHIVLRMIRMGNLSGNLLDYILFKLSFGKLGGAEKDESFVILK